MPTITYKQDDGTKQVIEASTAISLMRAALANQVPGIVGECGGSATCGTCHVYLEHSTEQLAPPSGDEEDMLEWTAAPRTNNSRLACQLVPTQSGAEVVVHVPAAQT